MNDFLKWFFKTVSIGILWVFLLSITVNGRSMFSYAHSVLVDNAVVQYVDDELADLWTKITETARVTFEQISSGERKA